MMALAEQDEKNAGNGRVSFSRERRCIVTGEVLPEARLLRFVLGPDSEVVPDVEAKLPGRGMWVRAERGAIAQAVAKRLFAKAAKAPVRVDANLAERAEARLVERMLAHLGLARRAGELFLGFDSVEKALRGQILPHLSLKRRKRPPMGGGNCKLRQRPRAMCPL